MKRPQAPKHRAKALGRAARFRYEAIAEEFERKSAGVAALEISYAKQRLAQQKLFDGLQPNSLPRQAAYRKLEQLDAEYHASRRQMHEDLKNVFVTGNLYDRAHLLRFFKRRLVADIDASAAAEYALHREKQGAGVPTINRELVALGEVLGLAQGNGKLKDFYIPLLQDDSPRVQVQVPAYPRGLPAGDPPRRGTRREPSRPRLGRRPELKDEELSENFERHKARPGWIGSDRQRANLLSTEDRPISHDQVRRARERLGLPPAMPPATRNVK